MSALKKEDVFNEFDELIETFSKEDKKDFADKVRSIKEKVKKLLNQEEEYLYNGIMNKSLEEVWDNEKDDAYNDL